MKKLILLFALFSLGHVFGQKLSADINLGGQFNDVENGFTGNVGIAYKLSPIFALRFDVGNTQFGKNSMTRTTLHVMADLTKALSVKNSNSSLFAHVGFGSTNRANKELFNDRYLLKGDDMLHFSAGLTPSFRINNKLRFQVDVTYFTYFKENAAFPYALNATAGLSYTF